MAGGDIVGGTSVEDSVEQDGSVGARESWEGEKEA